MPAFVGEDVKLVTAYEYNDRDGSNSTAKIILDKGSQYVTGQQLLADIRYRVKDKKILALYQTGKNFIWFVEFNSEEQCQIFCNFTTIEGEGYRATVSQMNLQATTIKIHWMPHFIRLSFYRMYFAKYGKVIDITRDMIQVDESYQAASGILTIKMIVSEEQLRELPHVISFQGQYSMLLTLPGRPPLFLKCQNVGHIRKDCPTNVKRDVAKTYASVARTNEVDVTGNEDKEDIDKDADEISEVTDEEEDEDESEEVEYTDSSSTITSSSAEKEKDT